MLSGCGEEERAEDPLAEFSEQVRSSTESDAADFPATEGRSIRELTAELAGQAQVGLATSSVSPGLSRIAFGVIDQERAFVFGPSAVYVAESPNSKALGPFPAPADPLVTEPAFRSQQAAVEDDVFAAIYDAEVEIGDWKQATVLSVTDVEGDLIGAGATVAVVPKGQDPVTQVGDPAPDVSTETVDDGPIEQIETRSPPDTMHETDFADVAGTKPVALLFATPQLCESRVCGPVTDIAAQLQQEYGDQMEFIHQEVFVDNNPQKGLRPPLKAFGLATEPWLFVVDEDGKVTARLEGSFGIEAFEEAVQSGLG
jgi:hypothetical protein